MTPYLKIKALRGLHLAAGSNKTLRLLEVLYVIKALWVDCPMPDCKDSFSQIAQALGLSIKQVHRMVDELQHQQFLFEYQLRGYEPISWDDLQQRFSIPHKNFYYIKYKPLGAKGNRLRLWHILQTKLQLEEKLKCKHAYQGRVKRHAEVKQVLDEVAGSALNAGAVASHQLRCFLLEGITYSPEEQYILSMNFHKADEKTLRADCELNYRTWSKLHGYKSRGGWAKMKRKLQQLGLITDERRSDPVPGHTSRSSRQNTRLGYVHYDIGTGITWLTQCNRLTVLPLEGLEERHQVNSNHAAKLQAQVTAPAAPSQRSLWVKKSWITRKAMPHAA